eukprot:COSAG06_NODE_13020_length_1301_cov_8.849286_1_plen_183_part_10
MTNGSAALVVLCVCAPVEFVRQWSVVTIETVCLFERWARTGIRHPRATWSCPCGRRRLHEEHRDVDRQRFVLDVRVEATANPGGWRGCVGRVERTGEVADRQDRRRSVRQSLQLAGKGLVNPSREPIRHGLELNCAIGVCVGPRCASRVVVRVWDYRTEVRSQALEAWQGEPVQVLPGEADEV